jgi:hypothetical protein
MIHSKTISKLHYEQYVAIEIFGGILYHIKINYDWRPSKCKLYRILLLKKDLIIQASPKWACAKQYTKAKAHTN